MDNNTSIQKTAEWVLKNGIPKEIYVHESNLEIANKINDSCFDGISIVRTSNYLPKGIILFSSAEPLSLITPFEPAETSFQSPSFPVLRWQ